MTKKKLQKTEQCHVTSLTLNTLASRNRNTLTLGITGASGTDLLAVSTRIAHCSPTDSVHRQLRFEAACLPLGM